MPHCAARPTAALTRELAFTPGPTVINTVADRTEASLVASDLVGTIANTIRDTGMVGPPVWNDMAIATEN